MQTTHQSKNRAQLMLQLKTNAGSAKKLIKKQTANQSAPLSHSQERLWIMTQLEPSSPIYNMAGALHLTGKLNPVVLQQSLNEVIRRHEILRSCFVQEQTQCVQRVIPQAQFILSEIDLTACPDSFDRCANDFIELAFDLTKDLPLRAMLVKVKPQQAILLLVLHHIVADRWSVSLLMQEVASLYSAFIQGLPSNLPELSIQYADFAVWQREQSDAITKQLAYWQQKLHNAPPLLTLPTDYARPLTPSYRGDMIRFEFSESLSIGLNVLAKQQQVTLFMLMAAAFSVLLSRYAQQKELCIGYPSAGRNQAQLANLIGFFVNTLVLRCQLKDDLRFGEYLKQIREQALQDQNHADLSFSQLVEALNPVRHAEHAPLFQVMLAVQNVPSSTLKLPKVTVTPTDLPIHSAQFDLTLFIEQQDNKLQGAFEYSCDLFDTRTINRMATQLQTLLTHIASNPERKIRQLSLLTDVEKQQFLYNQRQTASVLDSSLLIHQLVAKLAKQTPNALALVFAEQKLSYNELNQRANQLAHYLRSQGIKEESRVGVSATRSVELIIALLAVLKAGAAYVPLDPDYPQQRLDYVLADAHIDILLTQTALLAKFAQQRTVCIEQSFAEYALDDPCTATTLHNTAYMIYTSGSAGQPKAVLISHANLLHSTLARNKVYSEPLACFLLLSSFAFDSSVAGIFWTLTQGACLCLPQTFDLNDAKALATLINQHQVSHLLALPSFYHTLLHDRYLSLLSSLKAVIVAGEACSSKVANDHHQKLSSVSFYNEYGPTEASVWSTVYRSVAPESVAILPIGYAIPRTELLIMDDHGESVPIGVAGELYIGGAGVAQGYLQQASLTAEKFVPHPFADGQRLYRSGDLARYRVDGQLEFLGRIDHQVKIRGFRIELGEIENRLLQHPAINAVSVLAINNRLVAYVVAKPTLVSETDMLNHVKQSLPDYMLPSSYVYLDALPVTANGKLDRNALLQLDIPRSTQTKTFKTPSNDIEHTVLDIWREVLAIDHISVDDHFFALGGHSLAVIQVRSRINELFNIDMPAKLLFEVATIEQITKEILALQLQEQDDDALQSLLQQLELLSDEEALALLNA